MNSLLILWNFFHIDKKKTLRGKSQKLSNFSLSNASNRKEDEWVRALLRREEAAYRDLIVSFSSRLYKGIFQILRNEEESQEVLQDVFVKVLEKIQDFKGESQLGTWLYRIAVNEALMRLRSRKKVSSISCFSYLS